MAAVADIIEEMDINATSMQQFVPQCVQQGVKQYVRLYSSA